MKVTIGQIVHYQRYGSPGGEHLSLPSPAIVTEVLENGWCQLFVINPNGVYFNRTPYSEKPKPGHWNFPPRDEALSPDDEHSLMLDQLAAGLP